MPSARDAPSEAAAPPRVDRASVAVALALLACTLLFWGSTLDLPLVGWDTYPMIAAGRVDGIASLFGTFTEELMDGRYPLGHYWRPLAHLSFALDHALWGLDPVGYHLSDVVVVGLVAISIAWMVRRLVRALSPPERAAWVEHLAAFAAGAYWVLHPAHFDVLTVPARRADSLAVLFTVAAVGARIGAPRTSARALLVGVLAACALMSKETGAIAAPLVAVLSFLPFAAPRSSAPEGGARRLALRDAGIVLLVLGATLGLRTYALGGIGGSAASDVAFGATRVIEAAKRNALAVVAPAAQGWNSALGFGAALAWLVVLGAVVLARPRSSAASSYVARARWVLAFLGLWFASAAAMTAVAGVEQSWYALPFVAPVAVAIGVVAVSARALFTSPRSSVRERIATLTVAVSLGSFFPLAIDAGRRDALEDYETVGADVERFLEAFSERVRDTEPGGEFATDAVFEWVRVGPLGNVVRKIHTFGPYTLEAWAELTVPERSVRVSTPTVPSRRPPSDGDVRVTVRPVPWIERPAGGPH